MEFEEHLNRLDNDGLSEMHILSIKLFWGELKELFDNKIIPPATSPDTELGFQFMWSSSDCYIEIEIAEHGAFQWFAKNRKDNTYTGSENECYDEIPIELLSKLSTFFTNKYT